jgi:hypothetical protein
MNSSLRGIGNPGGSDLEYRTFKSIKSQVQPFVSHFFLAEACTKEAENGTNPLSGVKGE